MATTTTNYGFDVPTSSDLVKNGATQIALLGQDLDTFLFRPFTKNGVINGALDVWQRGTTFSTAGAYCADRWYGNWTGTATYSRESTTVPTGSQYAIRMTANTTSSMYLTQNIETLNAVQFAGQNVTFTLQAQGSVSTAITMVVQYSTNVDHPTTSSWTTITATSGGSGNASVGSFATISGLYAIPSTAKSILVNFNTTNTTAANYIIVGKVQFEVGSQATPFTRAGGTIQGELAACQRYYYRQTAAEAFSVFGVGLATSTTNARITVSLPVTLRKVAASLEFSTLILYDGATSTAITSAVIGEANFQTFNVNATVASGLTQFRPYQILANSSTSAYIGVTAEL